MNIDPTNTPTPFTKPVTQDAVHRDHQLKDSTKKLEGVFASFMLKELTTSLAKQTGNMPGGNIYSDFYSQILSEKLTEGRGLGLSDILYQSMSDLQKAITEPKSKNDEAQPDFAPKLESSSRTNQNEIPFKLENNLS